MPKKRLLSGIQASGIVHIGNYLGMIEPTIRLTQEYESILFIADLHALTTVHEKEVLERNVRQLAVDFLACGLDPEKSIFFRQSDIFAHAELAWILSCLAPMGLLERAHSYKDKINKGIEPTVGLFTYPVLMAADILLYKPDIVPVGKDQKQHLEIARDLAQKFNGTYGEIFPLPASLISEERGVIPGTDGQKMSKSYGNTIPLFAEEQDLKKKIMGIVTDSRAVEEPKDPDNCTIFELCTFFLSSEEISLLRNRYLQGGIGYGEAKTILFEVMNKKLSPLREKRKKIAEDNEYIDAILEDGKQKASEIAEKTISEIRKSIGFSKRKP
jgi:tryptophanyl-tRNA synthetase